MNDFAGRSVLVFDSGVGGLSVAASIRRQCPTLPLVYLADNAGFPYGDKTEAEVVQRSCDLVARAVKQFGCDIVVLACNTASTVALPALRQRIPQAVVGVVPAIKPAAVMSQNRRIGVLATPATIARPYLNQLVTDYAADCEVCRIGHPQLVHWAEALARGESLPQAELGAVLAPFAHAGVDTVVLGCTHYPLLQPFLQQTLPAVRFWVDSGDAIARRVQQLLAGMPVREQRSAGLTMPTLLQALFSGSVPRGIELFMAGLDLFPASVCGGWERF